MKKLEIGNEFFTIRPKAKFSLYKRADFLSQCYNSPSKTKEQIYYYYKYWFNKNSENSSDEFFIRSYNTFKFTLNGLITFGGKRYLFYITDAKNELYPIW